MPRTFLEKLANVSKIGRNSSDGFRKHFRPFQRVSVILATFVVCATLTAVFFYIRAQAASSLVVEDFSYSTGQLTNASAGANVSGGNWVTNTGTGFFIQVSSGSLSYAGYPSSGIGNKIDIVSTASSAEDTYRQFATQTSGTTYAAFLVNVTNTTGLALNTSTTGDYFAGFIQAGSTTIFADRVCIRTGSVAGTYQLGLRASSNAAAVFSTTNLNPGTTALVVFSYQIVAGATNDVANMWINPTPGGSEPAADLTQTSASDLTDIGRFFIRQGNAGTPNASLDGIRVGDTWGSATSPLFFRSVASGNWNANSTWESSADNVSWSAATTTPSSASAEAITIRNTHTVSVTANVDADQLMVDSGGTLSVNNGVTFTIADGAGTDLTDNGTVGTFGNITNNGQAIINGTLRIDQGGFPGGGAGTYSYDQTNGLLVFNNTSGFFGVNNNNYWPTSNGPQNVTVLNPAAGIQMNVARTVGTSFQYAAGVNGAGNLTLNGLIQVNPGGYVSGSPTFGSSSLLKYNTGGTYGRNGEWLPGVTANQGYPANVQLSGNTTLDLPNSSTTSPFQMAGNLTIDPGSTMQMAGATPMMQPLIVLGSVNINGTLTLSTAAGGDIHTQGNWSDAGTFNPNGRAVFFDGSAVTQTLSKATGETFNYLVINKAAGSVQLLNDTTVDGTAGNVLQLLGGAFDLNANTFRLTNNGGNILTSGGARTIDSSSTTSFIFFQGSKSISSASGGTLTFGANTFPALSAAVDFGANVSTVNGPIAINAGGSVSTNAPTYGANSNLIYNTGGPFGRGVEWTASTAATFPSAGYPNNVTVSNSTTLDMGANGGTATSFAANGGLSTSAGSTFTMATTPMTVPVNIKGDVNNGGTVTLSTASGGDLKLQGSLINQAGGTSNFNNRAVFFEGGASQFITDFSGALSIPYVVINKSGGTVALNGTDLTTLGPAGGNSLSFSNATSTLTLNARTLTLGSTVPSAPAGAGLITNSSAKLILNDGGMAGDMGTIPFSGTASLLNLTVNRTTATGNVALGSSVTVGGALTLTAGTVNLGTSTLSLTSPATVSRTSGYVIGNLQKTFTATGAFTYPVGTANGYSPVDANVTTAGGNNLSVKAVQGAQPNYVGANKLARYWTLAGSITADLTFNYLAADVVGTEANYKIFKYNGSFTQFTPDVLNTTQHFATLNNVSSFSDWTLAEPAVVLVPGTLQFSGAPYSDSETNADHTFTVNVSRTGGSDGAVAVNYAVTDGTATIADNDYSVSPASGTLNWADGDSANKSFTITVKGDTNIEPDETVNLTLSSPTNGATIGAPNPTTLTITNDDVAVNYTVTTTGNAIVVNDVSGNTDTLTTSEPAGGQISFAAVGRFFSVDGGAPINGNSGNLSLAGVTSIMVNQNAGNDVFSLSTFTAQLPSLTINGGTGNDSVQFNGGITFLPNANLDVDLQNDDPSPGVDTVSFTVLGKLHLSGTGSATIKVSQSVTSQTGAALDVVNGDLTIETNQQATPTPGNFAGASLSGMALATSGTGKISILGKGGSLAGSGSHFGLRIVGGTTISSTSAAAGAGTITLNGTAGSGTSLNQGVMVQSSGTTITSTTGNISITGQGGAGTSSQNIGVHINNGAAVTSTGAAKITIDGTGGSTGTSSNTGTRIAFDDAKVASSGGDISLTGHGGSGSGGSHLGVSVAFGALVSASGGAKIKIDGTAGSGTGGLTGVVISSTGSQTIPVPTKITSDSGDIQIIGHAGNGSGIGNIGVNTDSGAQVLATGAAGMSFDGTGGSGSSDCYGVGFEGGATPGTTVSAVNGNINLTGTATAATGTDQDGVRFEDSVGTDPFILTITGAGSLIVNGTAGDSDPSSSGINLVNYTNMTLAAASNTFIADTIDLGTTNVSVNAGANAITLRQKTNGTAISLGGADSATQLGLTDAELDVIAAGQLFIGDGNSGAITVSAPITRTAATILNLISGANIDFTTGSLHSNGGNVTLNPGTNVFPASAGTDVTTSGTTTLGITAEKTLKIVINNTTVDSGYTQLNVAGLVDITGVNLAVSGPYVPTGGEIFIIVNNDGAEPVTGTFNGLPEGAIIPNFLGSPTFAARITYLGGVNNNDVVLTVVTPTAAAARISGQIFDANGQPVSGATVTVSGGAKLIRTITDANGFYKFDGLAVGDLYTVTPSRANYVFAPANRAFSLVADKTDAVFTGMVIAPDSNPLESPEFFVRQQYLDFLGREPDQEGLDYWSGQLRACGADLNCARTQKIGVSAAFFMSEEFQRSGDYIYRLYRASLSRQVTYTEFTADHKKLIGGADLEALRTQFAEDFVQRPEFVEKYQNAAMAETFVDALLQGMLSNAQVDLSSQREALISTYNSAGDVNHSRSAVLRAVAERAEFKTKVYNPSFVLMEYFGYLQRDMDQDGFDFWVNVLDDRDLGNYRGMVCSFTTSAEYQRRFSSVVVHTNGECSR